MEGRQVSILLTVLSTFWSGILNCENGDVRLVDGFDNSSGRVEFCHEGEWGTVCDDNWRFKDAEVVCRQLGLSTSVASYLSSFGGGNGSIFIDNAECTGDEERLEDCIHNGIGHHDCEFDHTEDAGVICDPHDNNCTLEIVYDSTSPDSQIQTLTQPVTRTCLQRYGHCIPFRVHEQVSLCDDFYTSGVDYVFVPNTRNHGRYSRLMRDIITFGPVLLAGLDRCYEAARRIICHFYLPPCGNSTLFELPTSVCKETCYAVKDMCGEEWENVVSMFEQNRLAIEPEGQSFIECDDTGKHLNPLPYNCSDLGILSLPRENATAHVPQDNMILFFAVPTGAVVVIVVLTAAFIIVGFAFIRKHQKMPLTISKPTHPGSYRVAENTDNEILRVSISSRYPVENILQVPKTSVRLPRVTSGYIRQLTEEKLLIPREHIHLIGIVGQGEFGVVYRATLDGWHGRYMEIVAVKTLKVFSESELNKLVDESRVMAKFNHLNVMKLIGVSLHIRDSVYIVMPYMTHGSLLSYLRKQRADLTIVGDDNVELVSEVRRKLLSMCLQIANGMTYLASLQFVHRDLAARNCMIDENFVIKVSDFGLTEDIYARNYFRQGKQGEDGEAPVKLPVKWMALESLNDGIFSEKTDVWSFGVTCWEVFSLGKTPYPGVDPFTLIRYLERGERLEKPFNAACSQEIYSVIKECWHDESTKRPTFSELVTVISTSLEGMVGYLDLTSLSVTTELTLNANYDCLEDAFNTS